MTDDTASRFWSRVEKTGTCWLWVGYIKPNGYASFYPGGGRHVPKIYVHRYAFELLVGPIPDGTEIDHSCNVRHCVNPEHLQAVTHRKNLDLAKARRATCKNNHPLSGENLYFWRGIRYCRACRAEADARRVRVASA